MIAPNCKLYKTIPVIQFPYVTVAVSCNGLAKVANFSFHSLRRGKMGRGRGIERRTVMYLLAPSAVFPAILPFGAADNCPDIKLNLNPHDT